MKRLGCLLVATISAISVSELHAAFSVPITNGDFEAPAITVSPGYNSGTNTVPGWTINGGTGGVWNINDFPAGPLASPANDFWTSDAPDGKQVGWIASAPSSPETTLSQVLSATLQDNAIYTLTGQVGHPIGFSTTYTVALYAGGTLLNSISGTGPLGQFAGFSLSFNSLGSGLVGQALEIRLTSANAQTAFDSITLTGTPEPGSLIVWSLVAMSICGSSWLRNRKSAD